MTPVTSRVVAWAVFTLAVLAELASGVMEYLRQAATTGVDLEQLIGNQAFGLVLLPSVLVGAIVVSRTGGHLVGWLFLAMALDAFYGVFGAYASLAVTMEPSLPGATLAAWLSTLLDQPGPASAMLVFLLFPTGRLLSPRWRWVAGAVIGWVAVKVMGAALQPGPLPDHPTLTNPTGLDAFPGLSPVLLDASGVLPALLFPLCLSAVFVRFRRAATVERQQLKWILFSAALLAGAFALLAVVFLLGLDEDSAAGQLYFYGVLLPAVASVPVAAGIAILRYRLYDVDRVISRTLVYAVVMVLLASMYVGLVVALQAVLSPVTGESDLAVAASTLAVAAAFGPVRRRVQTFVNRRFYRSRYDATRTVDSFSHRLRDEIDVDALVVELRQVAADSVHPSGVSVWLPDPAMGR